MSVEYQLAQVNVAKMRAPLDDSRMAEFVAALDPINALAEQSPGFVCGKQVRSRLSERK